MAFTKLFEEARQAPKKRPHESQSVTISNEKPTKRRRRRKSSQNKASAPSTTLNSESVDLVTNQKPPLSSHQSKQNKVLRKPRGRPSQEALALSAKLKEFSAQKRLQDALELYWDESSDKIRDTHHACILVDCSARCGAIAEGEKAVDDMMRSGMHVSVETKTALLKGYAHAGMILKGAELFRGMCLSKDTRDHPNVRTLNTLLRGCLWAATSTYEDGKGNQILAGGVVTSETSWDLFRRCKTKEMGGGNAVGFDCSSYEYFIAQLCYSLRVEEAKEMIDEMKRGFGIPPLENGKETSLLVDPSVMESYAISMLALARASALLSLHHQATTIAKAVLNAVDAARRLEQTPNSQSSNQKGRSAGGKRSWKKSDDGHGANSARRSVSNSLFRSHRLSEVQFEAANLVTVCSNGAPSTMSVDLIFYLMSRLLYFSGGGTTELSPGRQRGHVDNAQAQTSALRCQLVNALWNSFGLRAAIQRMESTSSSLSGISVIGEHELSLIRSRLGMTDASVLADDGHIDFAEVFRSCLAVKVSEAPASSSDNKSHENGVRRPLDIELGSGYGDWIVHQAMRNPTRNYVGVELRADRVAQSFSKAILNGASPLMNLCWIGSECGSLLQRVRSCSVSTFFVNHPEPPTQTFGANSAALKEISEGGSEPAHMLTSETLVSTFQCLEPRGTLVVVTDNRWYARLICVTLLKAMKKSDGYIRASKIGNQSGIREVETFGTPRDRVILYEGQPSQAIGHSVEQGAQGGSSYFDRLWRSGAGTHAEQRRRFIISMERAQDPDDASTHVPQERIVAASEGGKNSRKKKDAKQKRRNERRLQRKAESSQV